MIAVSVVDDQPLFRSALIGLLEDRGMEVRSTGSSVEDSELDISVDVIVCELYLPGRSGARAVSYLTARGGTVLACSGVAKRQVVLDSLASGARGYISKVASTDVLAAAVETVASGDRYVSVEAARYLLADAAARPLSDHDIGQFEIDVLRHFEQGADASQAATAVGIDLRRMRALLEHVWEAAALRRSKLMPSRSERAVMALTVVGRTHAEIASELHMSIVTVPDHLKNIKAKYLGSHPDAQTDISPKAAAIAWATELGLTWRYGSEEFRWRDHQMRSDG